MTTTPELSINLNEPCTHIYEPGDTISGSAIFVPLFSARLRSLAVSLQGYCYTSSLSANAKVSHSVHFLYLSTSTLEEKYTYGGEQYEAPFRFVFPACTDVEHEAGPERLKPFFNQGPQSLPSSIVISARNCVQVIRYIVEVETYGRKRAVCEATVLFRQKPLARPGSENILIDVDDADDIDPLWGVAAHAQIDDTWSSNKAMYYSKVEFSRPPTDDNIMEGLSVHALPIITTHHKSALERYKHAKVQNEGPMRWVFKPWKTPKIVFMPSIYCPRRVAIGQDISLLLAVNTIENPVWHSHLQENQLLLHEFSLAITAHTRTIMQHRPHKRRWGRCLELSYAVFEATGLTVPIGTDSPPMPLVQNFKIQPGTIPSFSTYTLARGYSIDVFLKFSFGEDALQWGASMNLDIIAEDNYPPADGTNMDPLLFVNPKCAPQYFWRSHIEAGAAESTSRHDIYPDNPHDAINLPRNQWQTGHGRLPRTSFAYASGQLRTELVPVKADRGKAFSVIAGVCGRPHRRYLKDLEPMVQPLTEFKHGLGLDGGYENELSDHKTEVGFEQAARVQ